MHCQVVIFEIDTKLEEHTTCGCSICRRKNALMLKVYEDRIGIISGEDKLTTYTFNTHTVQYYFCSICGIYLFHRKRVTSNHFGINMDCLDNFDPKGAPVRATDGINTC